MTARTHTSQALRMVLAKINDDTEATQFTVAEIGECAGCWQLVAEALVDECAFLIGLRQDGGADYLAKLLSTLLDAPEGKP